MKEHLDGMTYQQLLKVARAYNLGVSIPLKQNISKEDLVASIMKHAKEVGRLLQVIESVKREGKPVKEEIPKIRKTEGMDEMEYEAMVRRRERALRAIDRAKSKFEPFEGVMSASEKKQYKSAVKNIKERYSQKM